MYSSELEHNERHSTCVANKLVSLSIIFVLFFLFSLVQIFKRGASNKDSRIFILFSCLYASLAFITFSLGRNNRQEHQRLFTDIHIGYNAIRDRECARQALESHHSSDFESSASDNDSMHKV